MNITLTGYCACKKCCGRKDGLTASGTIPVQGLTIAVPRSLKKLIGRTIRLDYIEGIKTNSHRRIEDLCGPGITSWDLFFRNHADAAAFGKRNAKITLL